jgi:hypothetical protein
VINIATSVVKNIHILMGYVGEFSNIDFDFVISNQHIIPNLNKIGSVIE